MNLELNLHTVVIVSLKKQKKMKKTIHLFMWKTKDYTSKQGGEGKFHYPLSIHLEYWTVYLSRLPINLNFKNTIVDFEYVS